MHVWANGQWCLAILALSAPFSAFAELEIREFEDALLVEDNKRPALSFALEQEPGRDTTRVRINVLYDAYGDPLITNARPSEQPAALDWGVERCTVGGRELGPYIGDTFLRTFERWSHVAVNEKHAALDLQRAWLDPDTGQAIVLETAHITVYPQEFNRRAIDVNVRLVNVGAESITLPAEAGFVARIDLTRPEAGFRTPENEYRTPSFRYQGPWLAGSSISLTNMKMIGLALFNNAPKRGGEAAEFVAADDGTLRMTGAAGAETLAPGDYTEWSTRVFCYVENLPAKAIQEAYFEYLTRGER